jgi:hypothetical protein
MHIFVLGPSETSLASPASTAIDKCTTTQISTLKQEIHIYVLGFTYLKYGALRTFLSLTDSAKSFPKTCYLL